MFTIRGRRQTYCDGIGRRQFLCAGALGLGGLTLADVLRSEAAAGPAQGRNKSIIYIVLGGGPSHIDMWDLKPHAPSEYRGPFRPIATRLAGVQICEHMPLQAAAMDRLALVRGIRSVENDHYLSEVYPGLPRASGKRPAFGSIASRLSEPPAEASAVLPAAVLPAYVSLDRATSDVFEYEKPHYAGLAHAPFRPFEESLEDLSPVESLDRLSDRRSLLAGFDNLLRKLDQPDAFSGLDSFQARALQMISSPGVRDAFDMSRESEEVLRRYGHKAGKYPHQTVKDILYDWDARPFVLARRLVEAGTRVVTLRVAAWDHHSAADGDIFFALRSLMPTLDQSVMALVDDLQERGLGNDVLVVVLGEFGRTPKISYPGPGREHWAESGCALFFGGGLRMGQVIGQTDTRAERSTDGQISFQNVMATMYRVLGIDPAQTLPDFNGRPQYLLDDLQPIRQLAG
ncbi:MAG: DUF1501 domain-containing protein [Pirellulales bacterium]